MAAQLDPGHVPPNPPPSPSDSIWKDWVALAGIVAVVGITGLLAWFYGRSGETATAAVVGLVVPVIGTIVGVVFGVSTGTKMGSAKGETVGEAKADVSAGALDQINEVLNNLQTAVTAHPEKAHNVRSPMKLDADHEKQLDELSTSQSAEIQRLLDEAFRTSKIAYRFIGREPKKL